MTTPRPARVVVAGVSRVTSNTVTRVHPQSSFFTQDSFLQTGSQDWNCHVNGETNFRTPVATTPGYSLKGDRCLHRVRLRRRTNLPWQVHFEGTERHPGLAVSPENREQVVSPTPACLTPLLFLPSSSVHFHKNCIIRGAPGAHSVRVQAPFLKQHVLHP